MGHSIYAINRVPSRIKYYLLDWKDHHMDEFMKRYPQKRLCDLSITEIRELFNYVSDLDKYKFR